MDKDVGRTITNYIMAETICKKTNKSPKMDLNDINP